MSVIAISNARGAAFVLILAAAPGRPLHDFTMRSDESIAERGQAFGKFPDAYKPESIEAERQIRSTNEWCADGWILLVPCR
jgi:hypothetical protein